MYEPKDDKKPDNDDLFKRQINTMKTLLEHGAISKQQYDFSSSELARKMHKTL